jgi:signal transduction histidine kinase
VQLRNDPPKLSTDTSKQALVAELWSQRFRDPLALDSLALPIIARDDELRAFGYLQLAWGYRYQGENAKAADALAHAQSLYFERHDDAGPANCRDLEATLLMAQSRHAEALELLRTNLSIPLEMRHPIERMITHDRCGVLHDLLGERDDSLRQRYAALDAARASKDPAAIAFALGMLGGVHADLYNLDDADQLCREGLSLIEPETAMHAWSLVALNHMNALLAMERGAEAAAHAERLLMLEPRLNQRAAEQRFIVYADAFAATGDAPRAQAMLDHSTSLRSDKQQSLISFTSAQIRAWNAQRQPERARALAETYLADPQNGTDPAQVPAELLRILQGTALACESLGDFRAALDYQKQAFSVHESLVGRSARARRLTLEIHHRIDRERWEREEAQRHQKNAEIEGQRLNALNQKLDAALQTRTRFLAAASHDLRQPAHALALYAQALEHETSRPALVDLSKRMRATVGSLSNMFDGLLELARLDAGAVKPQNDVFDLNELLARLGAEYADRLTHANALLKFRGTKGDCFIRSDVSLIERILRNLIGNAVKYAGEGNILVAVRPRESTLAIDVRDAGQGMTTEEQRHIFDEFYRASSANDRRDGLGLGLSIVERFARLLGMHIAVRSAPGRGTTFTLSMPIAQRVSRPVKSIDIEARTAASIARRIAVIDDDPDARESMVIVLTQWGHDCVAGESANDVLAHAQRSLWTPDALICDFQLRDRNAIADIAALRETFGASLPVLVVSGSHDAQTTITDAIDAAAYLPKPIRPLRLKSWVASLTAK